MIDRKDIATITVAVFLVVIVVGEITTYGINPYHCGVEVHRDGPTAQYSFDTNVNITYSCVSMDNSSNSVEKYYAYYDEDVASAYYRPDVHDALQYLKTMLVKFGINLLFIDTAELTDIMETEDVSGAIVIATGKLPDTVYTGNSTDPIFGWLSAGGMMYWIGGSFGSEYFDSSLVTHAVADADTLFFGTSDVIRDRVEGDGPVFDDSLVGGSLTDMTHQYYNECTYGVDVSKLTDPYVTTDYNYEGYYATAFVKYHGGSGALVIFGGGLNKYVVGPDVAQPVAQTIASRMTYDTVIIDYVAGGNAKGASGEVQCNSTPTDVFVFLTNGDFIFGRNVRV